MTTEPQVTVGLVGSDVLLASSGCAPAFPCDERDANGQFRQNFGMTLRDYFAGQSLTGQMASMSNEANIDSVEIVADWAYKMADAMVGRAGENERLKAELAGLRLACEDWIKIANSGANKLNEAVRRADDNHRQMMAVAESGRTWQATADAHLETIRKMRVALLDIASAVSPSRVFANADEQALAFIAKTATDALSGANR